MSASRLTPSAAPTLFAVPAQTLEAAIARVHADLTRRFGEARPELDLAHVADAAVRKLWGGQVKLVVPVLALRLARERVEAAA